MDSLVRKCPKCKSERSPSEIRCENQVEGVACRWTLFNEPLTNPAAEVIAQSEALQATEEKTTAAQVRCCVEGHPVEEGDIVCFVCGGEVLFTSESISEDYIGQQVGHWLIEERVSQESDSEDHFLVRDNVSDRHALLILYKEIYEPDPAIYQVMERMDKDHLPQLILTGRWLNRPYEIHERINYGSLVDAPFAGLEDIVGLKAIIFELAKALRDFAEVGLRHRNINPKTILLRERDPLDLVIIDFGSARLSDFDLDVVSPLTLTRYSAPEAIVGAVSSASDWWSLGMIVLEQITRGDCFLDSNEKAFLIHVVTRGVELPDNLPQEFENLLRGLLAKDPLERWQQDEVSRWLSGEKIEAPQLSIYQDVDLGDGIKLGELEFFSPERFSLAAAEASKWEEAESLLVTGELVTWLEEHQYDSSKLTLVKRINGREDVESKYKFALVLMVLNDALPLTQRGEIVTPSWITRTDNEGFELIFGPVSELLAEMSRETWLVSLKGRGEKVLDRARILEIDLDDFLYRQFSIVSSRAKLNAEEEILKEAYPDSDHAGLSSLMMRARLNDEDLIVLLSAKREQFTPLSMVVEDAAVLAEKHGIESFGKSEAIEMLRANRRKVSELLDKRIKDFARCGIEKVDDWADTFRIERRLSLQRSLVLLSVDAELWIPPEHQQYKENIVSFYEKRVINSILRGPLVRLTVGKTSSRIDITELSPEKEDAKDLLDFVLERTGASLKIDPQIFSENIILEQRLRRLSNQASAYRRDTGIDTLYVGFPFILMKDASIEGRRPRLAPFLLWPVKINFETSRVGNFTFCFDRDREEIRLNPALEGLLGPSEYEKYKKLSDELLSRSSIRAREVMEALGESTEISILREHPSVNHDVGAGHFEIFPSAVIFNAKFVGQAISEDLRQLRRLPIEDTALEVLLKVRESSLEHEADNFSNLAGRSREGLRALFVAYGEKPFRAEVERAKEPFSVVESDPSQDIAVRNARINPGIVLEGPPGTGKSQTIVNIVADCVGRGESVLIVCQKQAALNVVTKRLQAANLGQRICSIVDINRDRHTTIKLVREQLENLLAPDGEGLGNAREERENLAQKIDLLENRVNSFEDSIWAADEKYKISYREVICSLIGLDSDGDTLEAPELRSILKFTTDSKLYKLKQECSVLSQDWIDSNYENSPFLGLKSFSVDPPLIESIRSGLTSFKEQEVKREKILRKHPGAFDSKDAIGYGSWVNDAFAVLDAITDPDMKSITKWHGLFFSANGERCEIGPETYNEMTSLQSELAGLDIAAHDPVFFGALIGSKPKDLARLLKGCESALPPKSSLSFLNPFRIFRTKKIRAFVQDLDGIFQIERVRNLRAAIYLEMKLRPLRLQLFRILINLESEDEKVSSGNLLGVRILLGKTKDQLERVITIARLIDKSPRRKEAIELFKEISSVSIGEYFLNMQGAIVRAEQRNLCLDEIRTLGDWFENDWVEQKCQLVLDNEMLTEEITNMLENMKTIRALQAFRALSSDSDQIVFDTLSRLRKYEKGLRNFSSLEDSIQQIVEREAMLAWKSDIEQRNSSIILSDKDLDRMISELKLACSDLLSVNKKILADEYDIVSLGSGKDWESITRLRGPRTKKLREFLNLGSDLGLMKVRPVWLMNPEVVSQVLPLKARLFDVVVFDEASQLLVDHSIPSLFRSKRAVISGDEKQMPPSNSFSRSMDFDEEELPEELDEDMSEAEISEIEGKWNQKEIKDCPDLLALGRVSLPPTTLRIHYRSEYNPLIEFSNYAFYAGRLNVPAKHSDSEIKKVKPLEVRHMGGLYLDQTNPTEGEAIVEILREVWLGNSAPPSIGVVTFNLKQAELIEGLIQLEAADNLAFAKAYVRESGRQQNEEDMGFFVRNVENVQGDERDMILFSTTFGYNQQGLFRRNFGALGHKGGEKRLNVAVTRARQRIVILTSMPVDKISDGLALGKMPSKPRDYLQGYLDYANKVSEGHIELAKRSAKRLSQDAASTLARSETTDAFVQSVQEAIEKLGYRPSLVREEDVFDMDLALEDPETGCFVLGIECDAPRHDLLRKASMREIWRKKVLMRSVPIIHRISCVNWYQKRAHEEAQLCKIIEQSLNSSM